MPGPSKPAGTPTFIYTPAKRSVIAVECWAFLPSPALDQQRRANSKSLERNVVSTGYLRDVKDRTMSYIFIDSLKKKLLSAYCMPT